MASCVSADGTTIQFQQHGTGRPLVLLHGTGGSGERWAPLLPSLTAFCSPVVVDRRGRGLSADTPPYALAREFEDILAVIASLPGPVDVLAHSFGALCALEAALQTSQIRQLIVYEPPIPVVDTPLFPPSFIDALEQHLAAGDRDAVLSVFLKEVVQTPPEDFEVLRESPSWPARLAAAHTIPRELRAIQEYRLDAARLGSLRVPTLLLLGEHSTPFFRAAIEALARVLPTANLQELQGQQHVAMDTDPQRFLAVVRKFLGG